VILKHNGLKTLIQKGPHRYIAF